MTDTTITDATVADAHGLSALLVKAMTPNMRLISIYGDPRAEGHLATVLAQGPRQSAQHIRTLRHAGTIVGCTMWRISGIAHLDYIAVDPAFQGRGLSPRLLDDFEDLARAPLQLDCFASNQTALGLYRRRGYREVSSAAVRALPLPHNDGARAFRRLNPLQWSAAQRDLSKQGFANVVIRCGSGVMEVGMIGERGLRLRHEQGQSISQVRAQLGAMFPDRDYLIVPSTAHVDYPPMFEETSIRMVKDG